MKKVVKFVLLGLGTLVLIGIVIGVVSGPSASVSKSSGTPADASTVKSYVKVIEFTGDGKKKSPVFDLHGNHARLKYTYNSEDGTAGFFSVYVTPDGEDVMQTGGIPEIMSSAAKENSESAIQKSAGKYYLDVNAAGKWSIAVEEEQ